MSCSLPVCACFVTTKPGWWARPFDVLEFFQLRGCSYSSPSSRVGESTTCSGSRPHSGLKGSELHDVAWKDGVSRRGNRPVLFGSRIVQMKSVGKNWIEKLRSIARYFPSDLSVQVVLIFCEAQPGQPGSEASRPQ